MPAVFPTDTETAKVRSALAAAAALLTGERKRSAAPHGVFPANLVSEKLPIWSLSCPDWRKPDFSRKFAAS